MCAVSVAHPLALAHVHPPLCPGLLFNAAPDHAGLVFRTLADVSPSEIFEARSDGPVYVVVLAGEPVLPLVAKGVKFVAPVA